MVFSLTSEVVMIFLGFELLFLVLLCGILAIPALEGALGILLLTTIFTSGFRYFDINGGLGPDVPAFILAVIGLVYMVPSRPFKIDWKWGWWRAWWRAWCSENWEGLVWPAAFWICLMFCLLWPDFFPVGERLRDYALLSAAYWDPSPRMQEPWLAGEALNYYKFWYQFSAFLARISGASPWQLYHISVAFSMATLFTVVLRMLRVLGGFSPLLAFIGSFLVVFGSNVDGIGQFLNREAGYWGPSRVVDGAINEFPAWSFLLGDAHPHFLGLWLTPFGLLVVLQLLQAQLLPWSRLFYAVFLTLSIGLIHILGNVWEAPLWLVLSGSLLLTELIYLYVYQETAQEEGYTDATGLGFDPRTWVASFIVLLLCCSFLFNYSLPSSDTTLGYSILESLDIFLVPPEDPKALAVKPFWTSRDEFLAHWGIILGFIVLGILPRYSAANRGFWIAAFIVFLTPAIVWGFVTLIGITLGYWLYQAFLQKKKGEIFILTGLGICLSIIMSPEVLYLNDQYGGIHERMNTIFKVYIFAWVPTYTLALLAVARYSAVLWSWCMIPKAIVLPIFLVSNLGFFLYSAVDERMSPYTMRFYSEGLGKVEKQYMGATQAIVRLRGMPQGTVLEAPGNPYSWTTHVATLASQPSFLGWRNHLDLLYQDKISMIQERQKTADRIYKNSNCLLAKQLLIDNKISYVVLGPLERGRYGLKRGNLSCLDTIIESGIYTLYFVG